MNNKLWVAGLLMGFFSQSYATEPDYQLVVPNTFSDGTVASAQQINANFQTLIERLDVLDENRANGNLILDMNRDNGGSVGVRLGQQGGANILIGRDLAQHSVDFRRNVLIGRDMFDNSYDTQDLEAAYNVAVGYGPMLLTTEGSFNVAIGMEALSGWSALSNTSGVVKQSNNVAVGAGALFSYVGDENTAVGHYALNSTATHGSNTAVGASALRGATSPGNTAVGWEAAKSVTSGQRNTAVGAVALNLSNGNRNTALGWGAAPHQTDGNFNVALGYQAGMNNKTGSMNTAVGYSAGAATSGDDALENTLALGFQARVKTSNEVQIGNNEVVTVYLGRREADNSSNYNTNLSTQGVLYANTAILDNEPVIASDESIKTDIQELGLGLNFIDALRPVEYRRKASPERLDMGLIAQELEAELGNHGHTDNGVVHHGEKHLGVRYAALTAPMIKAIQELHAENRSQKNEIQDLRNQMDAQTEQLAHLLAQQEALVADLQRVTDPQFTSR